jgi:hypothetical protein
LTNSPAATQSKAARVATAHRRWSSYDALPVAPFAYVVSVRSLRTGMTCNSAA